MSQLREILKEALNVERVRFFATSRKFARCSGYGSSFRSLCCMHSH